MEQKRRRKFYAPVLFFMLIGMLLIAPQADVQAASAKAKALKAYKAFLSQKTIPWGTDSYYKAVPTSKCSFALAYIDKDSVPELVVSSGYVTHIAGFSVIFTYKNGKVQTVSNIQNDGDFYYYKKKGVCVTTYMSCGNPTYYYRKMSGTKLTDKLAENKETFTGKKTYYQTTSDRAKKISKSKFDSSLKKLVGSAKKTKAKFYKNTAKNRTKYLK